jgi:hypothetical protein
MLQIVQWVSLLFQNYEGCFVTNAVIAVDVRWTVELLDHSIVQNGAVVTWYSTFDGDIHHPLYYW